MNAVTPLRAAVSTAFGTLAGMALYHIDSGLHWSIYAFAAAAFSAYAFRWLLDVTSRGLAVDRLGPAPGRSGRIRRSTLLLLLSPFPGALVAYAAYCYDPDLGGGLYLGAGIAATLFAYDRMLGNAASRRAVDAG